MYQHLDIHKYTGEEINKNKKSLIDYIITSKTRKQNIIDVRVQSGFEIGSDRYIRGKISHKNIKQETKISTNTISKSIDNRLA